MTYYESGGSVILKQPDSFSVAETLECGQCFRFTNKGRGLYEITAHGRALEIRQDENDVYFYDVGIEEFEDTWLDYFDLRRDYGEIKAVLSASDIFMRDAVGFAPGIRILNQDPWECLISFIISQNNRIPMIKQVIKNLAELFGEKENGCFTFPGPEVLGTLEERHFRECKAGFRAKYLVDAAHRVASGEIDIYDTRRVETDELRERLMCIKGVGQKIADCVMIFSMGRREVFPTDVWIKRIMQRLYFNGADVPISAIHGLARRNFGEYAGYAQQYLYHYARINKIE